MKLGFCNILITHQILKHCVSKFKTFLALFLINLVDVVGGKNTADSTLQLLDD